VDIRSLRILRLALGTGLAIWFSQAIAWPLSFIAPVIATVLLGQPAPGLPLKQGVVLTILAAVALYASLMLLPFIEHFRLAGVLLLGLALFLTFYFTAKGGQQIIGVLFTMGIAVATGVGTVSIDAVLMVVNGAIAGIAAGLVFVWIAYWLLPDSRATGPTNAPQPPAAGDIDLADARHSAFRALVVVFPVALLFLLSSASTALIPVMIKVAAMGQQATHDNTRRAARSLLASTFWGGVAAVIGWQVLSVHPSLMQYALLVGLAGLVFGRRIFRGTGLDPEAETWSYAYLTMIVILAPAVLDGAMGDAAGVKFVDRLFMFVLATLYAVAAVIVFDAFSDRRKRAASVAGQ